METKYFRFLNMVLAVTMAALFTSCASIVSGRKQKVEVNSYPAGARIFVEGHDMLAVTPSTVKLPRKKNLRIVLQKEHYQDGVINQKGKFNGMAVGNIIFGAVPGLLVDWGTGAIYKYPKSINYSFAEPSKDSEDTASGTKNPEAVKRSEAGKSDLEKVIIRWFFDSAPRGSRVFWRIVSSVPDEVKNTNELYLGTTPYEETRSFNILGLTYENSRDVVIEVRISRKGYIDQVKRFNVRQAIDQQEISSFFELVAEE